MFTKTVLKETNHKVGFVNKIRLVKYAEDYPETDVAFGVDFVITEIVAVEVKWLFFWITIFSHAYQYFSDENIENVEKELTYSNNVCEDIYKLLTDKY